MDKKYLSVLNEIVTTDNYITIDEIATKLNVSNRKIYNDIKRVNDWLLNNNFPKLQQSRGYGYYIDSKFKETILSFINLNEINFYQFSPEERKAWIYIYIVCNDKNIFIKDLMMMLDTSRNTIISDIKSLKEEINQLSLNIKSKPNKGYLIIGEEQHIRKAIIYYLKFVTPLNGWHQMLSSEFLGQYNNNQSIYSMFDSSDLLLLKALLLDYENNFNVEFTDEIINEMTIWLYLFLKRMRSNYFVKENDFEKEIIGASAALNGARQLLKKYSQVHGINLKEDEVFFVAKYLSSAKVNYISDLIHENQEIKDLYKIVEKMVDDFQIYSAVHFSKYQKIVDNLYTHLKPTFYRMKYDIKSEHMLGDTVKSNYPEVFYLTKKVIHHFEKFTKQKLEEEEVSYIAIHFGGWLRREGIDLNIQPKQVLIVCTSGLGTSQMLESQLEKILTNVKFIGPVSLREYEQIDFSVDFIISTVPLTNKGTPVFVTKPILDDQEKERLLSEISILQHNTILKPDYSVEKIMSLIKKHAHIENEEDLVNDLKEYLKKPNWYLKHSDPNIKPKLSELLTSDFIISKEEIAHWEDAIKIASEPLISKKFVNSNYIDATINNITSYGPYIVISDVIGLPHAQPQDGVYKTGMSMLLTKKPIDLEGKKVYAIIVLASEDNEHHLKALSQLTKLVKGNKKMLQQSIDKEKILKLIDTYSNTIEGEN